MKILLVLAFTMFASFAIAEDPSLNYEKLYKDAMFEQLLKVAEVDPDLKSLSNRERISLVKDQTEFFTHCHMLAMNAYSIDIQDAAFNVANAGGSYADAKAALNSAIAVEGAAGGVREREISRALKTAMATGEACLDNVPENG